MKTAICLTITTLMALPVWAADLSSEVKSAAKKLADQPNYSWTTKSESTRQPQQGQGQGQGRGQGRGGFGGFGAPPSGKTEKDGFTVLTYKVGENTTEAVLKGGKVALKSEDEWKTGEELAEAGDAGGANRGRGGMARRVQAQKLPATEAQDLVAKVKDWKKDGDTYSGALTGEAIKEMYTFRGRPGGNADANANAPDTSGLKGTAKFWVKDGVLSKYESHVEGKMTGGRNNRESEVNRTTTVEIKDVGTTKLEVPAEAKKKLKA
jgi:hypothetical protein